LNDRTKPRFPFPSAFLSKALMLFAFLCTLTILILGAADVVDLPIEGVAFLGLPGASFLRRRKKETGRKDAFARRFETFLEGSPFPAWAVDGKSRRFRAVNRAALEAYKYTQDEFLALDLNALNAAEQAGESPAGASEPSLSPISVAKHKRSDGTTFYVELTVRPLEESGGIDLVHAVDVTERVATSEAIRASEAKLQQVFGSCPISVSVNRLVDGTFVDVNPEFTELTGWTLGDLKGRNAVECGFVTREDATEIRRRLSEHNTIIDLETVVATSTGKRRDVIIGSVVAEIGGEQRVISTIFDVTELRRAEKRNKAVEDRLRIVTQNARVGLAMISKDRRLAYVNQAYAELFELPQNSAVGRRLAEVHPTVYEQQVEPQLDRAFAGRSVSYELRRPTASGLGYYEVSYEPTVEGGKVTSLVAVVTDITDRMRAEHAREASEERYRTLFEYSPDGIAITDGQSRFIDVNDTLCRMIGCEREKLVGTPTTNIFVPKEIPHLNKTLLGHNADLQYYQDWQFQRTDGSTFPGEVMATKMPDGNTLTVIRDTSERKALEDQLLQAQKMEAIGVLAGGVAHDFNNILIAIGGYSDLLLDGMRVDDPLRDYVTEISQAGERAAALTSQLLSFSRRRFYVPVVHNLNTTITDTERMLRRIVKENIKFDIDLAPRLSDVKGDPGQISQVLLNLVVNAGDAMPHGGTITIRTRDTHLHGDFLHDNVVVPEGKFVELTVSDTGTGMDEQTRRRIFEPFYTTKEIGKGTGLGLSTVYGIVRQCGGDISVESSPGRGAAFKAYFPAATEAAEIKSVTERPKRHAPARGTILLVEDEPAVRNLLDNVLGGQGYNVVTASGGEEALGICASLPAKIDLLVTDMIMPGMDGMQLLKAATQMRPGLQFLIMSGYTGDIDVLETVDDDHFLGKPFSPSDLLERIAKLLEQEEDPIPLESFERSADTLVRNAGASGVTRV
jgi:two-component system cell cycle sensor histidine kinase/response regulator CckA